MSLHGFAFKNFHENISGVAVRFKFDFFETAESNQNIFVGVGIKFKFHGFNLEGFFVKFLFDDKWNFDFVKTDIFDIEVFIDKISYFQGSKIEHVFSAVRWEFEVDTDIKSLSFKWNVNGRTDLIVVLKIFANKFDYVIELLLLNGFESHIDLSFLIGFKFSFLNVNRELFGEILDIIKFVLNGNRWGILELKLPLDCLV